jgi:hypothetical protein
MRISKEKLFTHRLSGIKSSTTIVLQQWLAANKTHPNPVIAKANNCSPNPTATLNNRPGHGLLI